MSLLNNQVSFELAPGWDDHTVYSFMGPIVDGMKHLLTVTIFPHIGKKDLKHFADERVALVTYAMPSSAVLNQGFVVKGDGLEAYEWTYKIAANPREVQFRQETLLIRNRKGYIFAATYTKHSIKIVKAQVDAMINSFLAGLRED